MIKKTIFAACLGAAACLNCSAQQVANPDFERYPKVGRFEVEWLAIGTAKPFCNTKSDFGYDGGVQVRENIQGTPWSYGVALQLYMPLREYTVENFYIDENGNRHDTYYTETELVGGLLTGVVGEYDFNRGRGLNPYINANAGFCWGGTTTLRPYLRHSVGIEVFSHMRLSIGATLTSGGGSGFCFNISAVFGGGAD